MANEILKKSLRSLSSLIVGLLRKRLISVKKTFWLVIYVSIISNQTAEKILEIHLAPYQNINGWTFL